MAEALLLPTGLVTAAYLTRKLGPGDYGVFTLAATIVAWIEWTIVSVFGRATFKLIAEAKDWNPAGTTLLRLHFFLSLVAAVMLWMAAPFLSQILKEPQLSYCLRLFAVDIPLFSLAQAHRNILIGLGRFQQRAVVSAGRWLTRMIMMIVLVHFGFSINGAVWGSILASVAELVAARIYVRPSFTGAAMPWKTLRETAMPLFLFAMSIRIFEKLDLVSLKALGGTTTQAGFYGAAQNLSLIAGIFALSFSPLLLSALSELLAKDQLNRAKDMARSSMNLVIALVPFCVLASVSSSEIVSWIFGKLFMPAAPVFSFLLMGALSLAMISVTTAILTAAGKPVLTFLLAGPLVPVSLAGYWWYVPDYGPTGAAAIQALVATGGALLTIWAVHKTWRVLPAIPTVLRAVFISTIVYFCAPFWLSTGWFIVLKITFFSALIAVTLFLLGEHRSYRSAVSVDSPA